MASPFQDREFLQLRRRIVEGYEAGRVGEGELMVQQNELLEECKERLERRRGYETLNNMSLNITSISSIPNLNLSNTEDSFRNKFTEEFENSVLNAAIKEVKNTCSEDTFDTFMSYVLNNRTKEYEDARRELDRKNGQIEELSALIIIKQKDINSLTRELTELRVRDESLDEEKRKWKKRNEILTDKEQRLHSSEMSLVFKEKLNLEGKRRYQRQKQLVEATVEQLRQVGSELEGVWGRILERMDGSSCDCEGVCWRQEVMRKCKLQLVEQRRLLEEEARQLESEFEMMVGLSEQIKKAYSLQSNRLNQLP